VGGELAPEVALDVAHQPGRMADSHRVDHGLGDLEQPLDHGALELRIRVRAHRA
jgi:hypothetical protein